MTDLQYRLVVIQQQMTQIEQSMVQLREQSFTGYVCTEPERSTYQQLVLEWNRLTCEMHAINNSLRQALDALHEQTMERIACLST